MTEPKKRTILDQNSDVKQSVKEERIVDDFDDDYDEAAELFGPDSSFTADRLDKDIFRPLVSTTPTQQYNNDEYNEENDEDYVPDNERKRRRINPDETKSESDEDVHYDFPNSLTGMNKGIRDASLQQDIQKEIQQTSGIQDDIIYGNNTQQQMNQYQNEDEDEKVKMLKILQRIVEPEVVKANYLTTEDQIIQDIPIPERLLLIHIRKRMSLEEGRLHLEDKFRLGMTPIMEEAEWIVRHFYTKNCPYPVFPRRRNHKDFVDFEKAQSPNYLIKSKAKISESKQEEEYQQRIFQEKKRGYSEVAEKAAAKIHRVLSIMLNEKKEAGYIVNH
ncbi:MAG: hypothetical protein EZS28_016143, partial [Streblomastix strix]